MKARSIFLISSVFLVTPSVQGAVVHEFTNSSAGQKAVNYLDGQNGTDWSAAVKAGSTVTQLSATAPVGGNRTGVGETNGAVGTSGVGYLYSVSDGAASFAFTGTFAPVTTTSVSWYMGNSTFNIKVQLLVHTAGTWLISDTVYDTSATNLNQFNGAETGGGLALKSANLASMTWKSYDLDTMTIGTAATLDSLDLTGVGFLSVHAAGSTARFDNLTLIPEPSVALLGGIGALALLRRRVG